MHTDVLILFLSVITYFFSFISVIRSLSILLIFSENQLGLCWFSWTFDSHSTDVFLIISFLLVSLSFFFTIFSLAPWNGGLYYIYFKPLCNYSFLRNFGKYFMQLENKMYSVFIRSSILCISIKLYLEVGLLRSSISFFIFLSICFISWE